MLTDVFAFAWVDVYVFGDAATVFRKAADVVQIGQDPRRCVEDVLQRFRDLILVNAVPEATGNILYRAPAYRRSTRTCTSSS